MYMYKYNDFCQEPSDINLHTVVVAQPGRSPVAVWMDVTQTLVIVIMEDHRDVYKQNFLDIHGQEGLVEQVRPNAVKRLQMNSVLKDVA